MHPRVNFIHQTRRRNFGASHRVKISIFTRHKTSYTKFPPYVIYEYVNFYKKCIDASLNAFALKSVKRLINHCLLTIGRCSTRRVQYNKY